MNDLDKARATHLKNIKSKTGKSLAEIRLIIEKSKLTKHSEIRQMLMEKFDLGYGHANGLVHYALESDAQSAAKASGASMEDLLDEIYSGRKEELRSIHEKVMTAITKLGDFDIAPKKAYVSLRRKKQFAMVGPASKLRVEVGLNMKSVEGGTRLIELPKGGMCQYKVFLSEIDEVDKELMGWVKQAYDSAG